MMLPGLPQAIDAITNTLGLTHVPSPQQQTSAEHQARTSIPTPTDVAVNYSGGQQAAQGIAAKVAQGSIFFRKPGQGIVGVDVGGQAVCSITFDLILSEEHEFSANVCQHPVQGGDPITDHIQPMPQRGKFQVLVTNYSINRSPNASGSSNSGTVFDATVNQAMSAYATFKSILRNRISCTLTTVLEDFQSSQVAFTKVSVPRTFETGEALVFDVEYIEIRTVQLRMVKSSIVTAPTPAPPTTKAGRRASLLATSGTTSPPDVVQDSTSDEGGAP